MGERLPRSIGQKVLLAVCICFSVVAAVPLAGIAVSPMAVDYGYLQRSQLDSVQTTLVLLMMIPLIGAVITGIASTPKFARRPTSERDVVYVDRPRRHGRSRRPRSRARGLFGFGGGLGGHLDYLERL